MSVPDIANMSVAEVMNRWPDAIGLFIRLDLSCVGCPIGRFHTVSEAAAAHRLRGDDVLAGLVGSIGGKLTQQPGRAPVADEE